MKDKIIEKIKKHEGHGNAISVDDLRRDICSFSEHKLSDKECRDLVVELIMENKLIMSCVKGYYIPITEEDFAIGVKHLTAPFEKMRRRIEQVKFLWSVRNTGNLF